MSQEAPQKLRSTIFILRSKDPAVPPRLIRAKSHAHVKAYICDESYFEPERADVEEAALAAEKGAKIEEAA